MRVMRQKETGTELKVSQYAMTINKWEYYLESPKQDDPEIAFGLVCGFEDEMGNVYLPEICEHIFHAATDLNDIMPAPGWEWVS